MPIFQPFKVVTCSFIQLIKGNTKGVTFKVNIIVVKYQAVQYSRVGLAKLLFKNISLLAKVYKDSQFKVKIIVFTAVFGLVGIELSQVSQLLTIGLHLGGLRICNLRIYSLRIYNLRIYSLRIYSLRIHSLQIYGLRIYSLRIYGLRIRNLNNGSDLVHILVYRGVVVRSLKVGCILANRVNSEAAQVYGANLVK